MIKVFLQLGLIFILILSFSPLFFAISAQAENTKEKQRKEQGKKDVAKQGKVETFPLSECWNVSTDQSAKISLASDNVSTLFLGRDGLIEALNIKDGQTLWKTELGGGTLSDILYDKDKIYLVNQEAENNEKAETGRTRDIIIRSIGVSTGLPVWERRFPQDSADYTVSLTIVRNHLYLISSSGEIIILESRSGTLEKDIKLGFQLTGRPVVYGENLYVGTLAKTLAKFSLEKNELIGADSLKDTVKVIYADEADKDQIFIGDAFGVVYAYRPNSRKVLWKVRTGAEIIDIKKDDQDLYIASNDNFIYSVSVSNGNIIWRKRLSGRSQFTLFKNENGSLLLTVTLNTDTFTISDLNKGKTINQMLLQGNNYYVGNPVLLKDFVVIPTTVGLSTYSLAGCPQTEKSNYNKSYLK